MSWAAARPRTPIRGQSGSRHPFVRAAPRNERASLLAGGGDVEATDRRLEDVATEARGDEIVLGRVHERRPGRIVAHHLDVEVGPGLAAGRAAQAVDALDRVVVLL